MQTIWKLTTKTGSVYTITDKDGTWTISADNKANEHSRQWPDGHEVEIFPPNRHGRHWPPEIDGILCVESIKDDPIVMRNGYLQSSTIKAIEVQTCK